MTAAPRPPILSRDSGGGPPLPLNVPYFLAPAALPHPPAEMADDDKDVPPQDDDEVRKPRRPRVRGDRRRRGRRRLSWIFFFDCGLHDKAGEENPFPA